MDTTKIQTSFIPQKPMVGNSQPRGTSRGLVYLLGVTLFVVSVVASVALFSYQKILEGQIAGMEKSLSQARETLQPEIITELSKTDQRFVAANEIINKHESISLFFDLLSKLTLPSLRFSSMDYTSDSLGITVKLSGEAKSYAIVALQSKILSEEPLIKKAQFSDEDLNDLGNVTFSLNASIDPKTVSYKRMVDALNPPALPESPSSAPVPTASDNGATNGGTSVASTTTPVVSGTTSPPPPVPTP